MTSSAPVSTSTGTFRVPAGPWTRRSKIGRSRGRSGDPVPGTSFIDVLDAQRRYFDAQIGVSNAVRDEHLALVDLYKALGGGWAE